MAGEDSKTPLYGQFSDELDILRACFGCPHEVIDDETKIVDLLHDVESKEDKLRVIKDVGSRFFMDIHPDNLVVHIAKLINHRGPEDIEKKRQMMQVARKMDPDAKAKYEADYSAEDFYGFELRLLCDHLDTKQGLWSNSMRIEVFMKELDDNAVPTKVFTASELEAKLAKVRVALGIQIDAKDSVLEVCKRIHDTLTIDLGEDTPRSGSPLLDEFLLDDDCEIPATPPNSQV